MMVSAARLNRCRRWLASRRACNHVCEMLREASSSRVGSLFVAYPVLVLLLAAADVNPSTRPWGSAREPQLLRGKKLVVVERARNNLKNLTGSFRVNR